MMETKKYLYLPFLVTLILLSSALDASEDSNITQSKNWIILPYLFSSDSTGFSGGIGMIKQGLIQPETTLVASVFAGINQDVSIDNKDEKRHFKGAFVSFSNLKLPYTNRIFFSLIGLKSYFPNEQYYLDGSNNSKKEDVFTTSGDSNFFNTDLRYVFPLGDGLDNPKGIYTLKDGFAMNRGNYGGGTPFLTGRTSIGIKTFYQSNNSENWIYPNSTTHILKKPKWNTNGLKFFLAHENTDFDLNPSRGYQFQLQYSKDFGKGSSLQSWDFLEFKYNQYFNLENFSFTKQNVLALSLWTGYSFSWDNTKQISPFIDTHRTPLWEGGRLGGFNRMRGYDTNRFSDKAVLYATAEYRSILKWNPFRKNDYIPIAIDWLQVVGFVEAGRVHNKYNFDLLNDMKFDAGVSLRAMAAQLPVRFDVAYGNEGWNMWVMIRQPFDF